MIKKAYLGDALIKKLYWGSDLVYSGSEPINSSDYLTIRALDDGLQVSLSENDCEYCINESGEWKLLPKDTLTETIEAGHMLSFRGNLIPKSGVGIGTFTSTKQFLLMGNITSMLFGDQAKANADLTGYNYAFMYLFKDSKILYTSITLKASKVPDRCYHGMFMNCKDLKNTPRFAEYNLGEGCYCDMFCGCDTLVEVDDLPASIMSSYCYTEMFRDCISLKTAPVIGATTLAYNCFGSMFWGCTALTSTLQQLPATTLAESCYSDMFYNCRALTAGPELPATTLAESCYSGMFKYCKSLKYPPKSLPATDLSNYCYKAMFYGCTSLESVPQMHNLKLKGASCHSMFYNCSNIVSGSNITIDSFEWNSCEGMFKSCSKLAVIPTINTGILKSASCRGMFEDCTSLYNVSWLTITEVQKESCKNMFTDCVNLEYSPLLLASTLAESSYCEMFLRCTKLMNVTMTATDITATDCLSAWISGSSELGIFTKHPYMNDLPYGVSGIPDNWIIVNDCDIHDGYLYVDLGLHLGTLWSVYTVGTGSFKYLGDLFAWGETEEKTDYSWENYKWCDGDYRLQTKYCTNSTYGVVDNKTTLDLEDDAAYIARGGNWRTPTETELLELCNQCTWVKLNSVYILTGPNGNKLYITGPIWSNKCDGGLLARYLNPDYQIVSNNYKCSGQYILPVLSRI